MVQKSNQEIENKEKEESNQNQMYPQPRGKKQTTRQHSNNKKTYTSCAVDAVKPVISKVHDVEPPPTQATVVVLALLVPALSVPANICVELGADPPSAIPTHREFSVAEETCVTVNLVP